MEYLEETDSFGKTYQRGDNLEEFLKDLVQFVERRVFERISRRVNFILTRINDNKLEVVADGNSDKNKDGNWRMKIDSDEHLIIQENINGTWTDSGWILEKST